MKIMSRLASFFALTLLLALGSSASAGCIGQEVDQVKLKSALLAATLETQYGYTLDHISYNCADFGQVYRFDYRIRITGYDYVFFVVGSEYAQEIGAEVWGPEGNLRGSDSGDAVPVVQTQIWNSGVFRVHYKVLGTALRYSDAMVALAVMKRPR